MADAVKSFLLTRSLFGFSSSMRWERFTHSFLASDCGVLVVLSKPTCEQSALRRNCDLMR
jgi:hypothetical protein